MSQERITFAPSSTDQKRIDEELWQFLQANRATPMAIDLAAMPDMSATRLQLLISAKKQWVADGVAMIVNGMNETLSHSLARLGVPENFFDEGNLQ